MVNSDAREKLTFTMSDGGQDTHFLFMTNLSP